MDYGDVVYDTISAKDNQSLQRLQNCALKIVLQAPKRTPTSEIHKELNMNYVADRRHQHTLTQVYKCLHGLAPRKICQQITKLTDMRDHGARQTRSVTSDKLFIPNYKLEITRGNFRYRGPMIYNMLDQEIKDSASLEGFKRALRGSHMFEVL